jgi:hypothetical protein
VTRRIGLADSTIVARPLLQHPPEPARGPLGRSPIV